MSFFKDKTILVTGAGGSIGSELCRQLFEHDPDVLILFDSSELALYNIDRELNDGEIGARIVPALGDVTYTYDVNTWLHGVDIVFHTAAYKHVTLCENNRTAAERVNVRGTRVLVEAAKMHAVPTLILISTDKAVRPTCVMGRTKQAAEEIVRAANYTTVRLGNVYGSSGSVVPLWKEQIAKGEPVTITHPGATRYFISHAEAARRILEAAEMAVGGETFVPQMGTPSSIVQAARNIGAREFKYIGLRPGEKLHEELFVGEKVPTPDPFLFKDAA